MNLAQIFARITASEGRQHRSYHSPPGLYNGLLFIRQGFSIPSLPHTRLSMALTLLLYALSLALLSYGWPEASKSHNPSELLSTCNQIKAVISSASQVFFPRERVIFTFVPI
jgi:hypothetical protein